MTPAPAPAPSERDREVAATLHAAAICSRRFPSSTLAIAAIARALAAARAEGAEARQAELLKLVATPEWQASNALIHDLVPVAEVQARVEAERRACSDAIRAVIESRPNYSALGLKYATGWKDGMDYALVTIAARGPLGPRGEQE
jgi:hypothetical protein